VIAGFEDEDEAALVNLQNPLTIFTGTMNTPKKML
jgi:hypothetical protein